MRRPGKIDGYLRREGHSGQALISGIHIEVKNLTPVESISSAGVQALVSRALRDSGIISAQLSVLFVRDSFIRHLNKKFLKLDQATDVLAFDLKTKAGPENLLVGDIVVSVDTALTCAKRLRLDFGEELARYVIHGLLHFLGYDDATPSKKEKMWNRQEDLLARLSMFKRCQVLRPASPSRRHKK